MELIVTRSTHSKNGGSIATRLPVLPDLVTINTLEECYARPTKNIDKAKIRLYILLINKHSEKVTKTELEIIYLLSRDETIQERLDKSLENINIK